MSQFSYFFTLFFYFFLHRSTYLFLFIYLFIIYSFLLFLCIFRCLQTSRHWRKTTGLWTMIEIYCVPRILMCLASCKPRVGMMPTLSSLSQSRQIWRHDNSRFSVYSCCGNMNHSYSMIYANDFVFGLLIFPWTKWPPFRRRHFRTHFLEWKSSIFLLKFHWSFF